MARSLPKSAFPSVGTTRCTRVQRVKQTEPDKTEAYEEADTVDTAAGSNAVSHQHQNR
jgi:hypothetical protein